MEISLSEISWKSNQEEWIIESTQDASDQYWRVGESFLIRNKDASAYLCAHKRRLKENDEYEVFGQ